MRHLHQRAGTSAPTASAMSGAPPSPPVPFEAALLALGEESGKLEEVFQLLADYFRLEDRMMQRMLKVAAYPMFTALAATFIAPLPLIFLNQTGAYLLSVLTGLTLWVVAGGTLLTAVTRYYLNQPKYVLARLLRALTFAVEAGLGLGRAAVLAADASGSAEITAHVRRQPAQRLATQPLSETFKGCPHLPYTATAAMEVAEKSGDYGGTLRRLAELHDS